MKCPLCDRKMHRPLENSDLQYYCEGLDTVKYKSHFYIDDDKTVVNLFPFVIQTYSTEPSISEVFHWNENTKTYTQAWSGPVISLEPPEKLLARLKLLLVFS